MLKIKLTLEAEKDIPKSGFKKGQTCEIINEVFDKHIGIAYFSIDRDWKVVEMKIMEYKPI